MTSRELLPEFSGGSPAIEGMDPHDRRLAEFEDLLTGITVAVPSSVDRPSKEIPVQLRTSKFVSRSAMIMASGVLLVGVVACADDSPKAAGSGSKTSGSATSGSAGSKSAGSKSDSDGASSEQASSGTDFCGSLLALNRIDPPGEGPIPPTPDQLKEWSKTIAGPFAAVSAAAPDAVLDQVASLSSAITKASSGDGTVFDDGSTEEAHEGLEDQARKDCDWQRADVEASDFKFSGVPATVDAGALSVRLSNTSTVGTPCVSPAAQGLCFDPEQ
ncbi:MAG: hypothetical protein V9F03_07190 [Microthrixaceae bacterium]